MDIEKIISEMTVEEKASLCSGESYWFTQSIDRFGIRALMFSDGPNGLRKQDLSQSEFFNKSIVSVCYPTGSCVAASFDRNLIKMMGKAMGSHAYDEGISLLLAPAMNIKRTPICGRNFEYYSEDSFLTGELAAAFVDGVQSQGVGACPKHFVANNQEFRRQTYNAQIDERTLREVYLAPFETVVKKSSPQAIMTSYNRVNSFYCSENKKILNDITRGEWGFEGLFISDWGGTNDRPAGLLAGLDIEMPSSNGVNDKRIVEAYNNGIISDEALNATVRRVLNFIEKSDNDLGEESLWTFERQHDLAVEISSKSSVLLKNDNDVLPLNSKQKVLFIGEYALNPRIQGGGSAFVNSYKITNALESSKKYNDVYYAKAYLSEEDFSPELLDEALDLASICDVSVVFIGLSENCESEGYDRQNISLPDCQNDLIYQVAEASKKTVVVLHNGSPVEMPWLDEVDSVLEVYLGGQGVGEATADILFGRINPSGKLAETFPKRLEDNPTQLFFSNSGDNVEYREGIFVGYKYYDKKHMDVLFPFGHGLSYTEFEYSNLKIEHSDKGRFKVKVSVDIENIGKMDGEEIVQLYVSAFNSDVVRPVKELKGFEKVFLFQGQKKKVEFVLGKRAFSYYDEFKNDFYLEGGKYKIIVAKSSADVALGDVLFIKGEEKIKKYSVDTTFAEIQKDENAKEIFAPFIEASKHTILNSDISEERKNAITEDMLVSMIGDMPLRGIFSFTDTGLDYDDLFELIDKANNESNK